ncbi:MAG TPA: argininosuccinate lyase [Acidimicrobiia bacterium]|nr:argininosuccinate lyase [Acidimicrobiia bacterium]
MTLWGGRFDSPPGETLWDYTTDDSDRRLLADDVDGSIAHVTMLGETGILATDEVAGLLEGLDRIREEASAGVFEFGDGDEDVHTAVERRLADLIGELAGKLHTGRSRNDQVALDMRLYTRRAASDRIEQLHRYALTLADLAESNAATVVPSYTHLQQAQPTTLGHHLMAYAWMALRDAERFGGARHRIDVSPLGAGASAGTSLPIDPESTARALGMRAVFDNSLDAVGSRDHLAEFVFSCSQAMVHLSRFAEELIFWATPEFGHVRLGDSVTTGSSALPQKRNPDIAELVRGRAARVLGLLGAMMALQKGLPLSYNRDLQEDKRLVFDADDVLAASLHAMTEMLGHTEFLSVIPMVETASLDLAEALVGRGIPFREAHGAVGRLVLALEGEGRSLGEAAFADLAGTHDSFVEADLELIDPAASVARRHSPGGGSPESVHIQVAELRRSVTEPGGQAAERRG